MKKPLLAAALILVSIVAVACGQDQNTTLEPGAVAFNKGGGSGSQTDPTARFYLPSSQGSSAVGIWGDGNYTTNHPDSQEGLAGRSRYRDSECAVSSKIFATTAASNSGDAIMEPGTAKNCAAAPRRVRLDFTKPDGETLPGTVELVVGRMNVIGLQNTDPTSIIRVGEFADRPLNMALTGSQYCDGLRFRPTLPAQNNQPTGADLVRVTRVDARTWHVTNAGADKAACLKNGVLVAVYHIPVDFFVVADRNLPVQ